jgi:hypothetical protein
MNEETRIRVLKEELLGYKEQRILVYQKYGIKCSELKEIQVQGTPPKRDKMLDMCMELELLDKTIRKFEKYLDTYNKNKP